MSHSKLIEETIADHIVTTTKFQQTCSAIIEKMGEICVEAIRKGNKICFFGNGGSAADSQHLATEIVVRYTRNRKGLPALAFTVDTSTLTACANDFGYDSVFARQVEALCVPGDIVVGISTSGTSGNVVEGLRFAKENNITTFAFTGEKGATCGEIADQLLAVPSTVTARVQECHLIAGHLICDIIEIAFADQESKISAC
jgi:D-sedoheptulose 7-phosphate isomerase